MGRLRVKGMLLRVVKGVRGMIEPSRASTNLSECKGNRANIGRIGRTNRFAVFTNPGESISSIKINLSLFCLTYLSEPFRGPIRFC